MKESTARAGTAGVFGAWVILNAGGAFIGFLAAGSLLSAAAGTAVDALDEAVIFGLLAAGLGLGQWIAVRRVFAGVQLWPVVTLVGGLIAGALADGIADIVNGVAVFAVLGLLIGLGQWLLLRRTVAQAWYWAIACALGWTVGIRALAFANASSLVEGLAQADMLGPALDYALMAGLASLVSGAALVWLLKEQA